MQTAQRDSRFVTALVMVLVVSVVTPCFGGDKEFREEVRQTIQLFKQKDPGIQKFFDTAHGYAVFPTVGKGGVGIGGARGKGLVYEKGKLVGQTILTQVTIGLQLGGQAYAEVVFLENQQTMESFKQGNLALSAQVSAVAAAEGASANAKYKLGVVVFTMAKSGLMYEASVGGQNFSFTPLQK